MNGAPVEREKRTSMVRIRLGTFFIDKCTVNALDHEEGFQERSLMSVSAKEANNQMQRTHLAP